MTVRRIGQALSRLVGAALSALMIVAVTLAAASPGAAKARPFDLRVERIAVAPTFLPDGVEFLVGYELTSENPHFAALSGVDVEENELIATTERGYFVLFTLRRDIEGRILGFASTEIEPQLNASGERFEDGAAHSVAMARDSVSGLYWAAYEHDHRILGRRELNGAAIASIAQLSAIKLPEVGGGVRALATARNRALIAIAAAPVRQAGETPRSALGPVVGWRLAAERAERFEIERTPGFRPSGADFGPDGALYLLETRPASPGRRGALRVRRFDAEAVRDVAETPRLGAGKVVLELTDAAPIGRMEGLAVDAAENGDIVLTLVSGDGEAGGAATRLLQFQLTGAR